MKRPDDSSAMVHVKHRYFTAVEPRETLKCPACNRKLMVFSVLGEDDLLVWQDERPSGMGFTEFVEEKLEERRRTKMH